jgi:sulfur carrier protein
VADLVADLAATGQRFAVEVNEELVPRSLHGGRALADGDRVEVVHAIGGG